MRLRIMLSIVTVALVYSLSFVPEAVVASLPRAVVATAGTSTYSDYVNCSGEIMPAREMEIYCAVPVYATEVLVSVGDRVEAGQTLAIIDTEISGAVGAGNTGGARDQDYSDMLEQYGLDSEAAAKLLAGYSSTAMSTEKVEYQQYDIPQVLTAPMSGIITGTNISAAVLTDNTKPLFTVADDSSYGVRLFAGESDISKVSVGDTVEITGAGFSGTYAACVTKIYPTATKKISGTATETVVELEAVLAHASDELKSGFSAKGRILVSQPASMVTVPYGSVRQDKDNVEYVYVFNDNRAVRRNITTGIELTDTVEVTSGLRSGESVVLNPDDISGDAAVAIGVLGK